MSQRDFAHGADVGPRGRGRVAPGALRFTALPALLLLAPLTFAQPASKPPEAGASRALPTRLAGAWTGDFDGMIERRAIRVLVPYSRTLYFNDRGRERACPPISCAISSVS